MTNYPGYEDESACLAQEMQADGWADRESELGPEDDWPSSWFADQQ
jgi:hypothetical protein